jgi:hypothetical protein
MREPIVAVATDDAPRAVRALRDSPGVLDVTLFGRQVHVVVEQAEQARERIPALLREAGIACHGIWAIAPSLEDVFAHRVQREGGAVAG